MSYYTSFLLANPHQRQRMGTPKKTIIIYIIKKRETRDTFTDGWVTRINPNPHFYIVLCHLAWPTYLLHTGNELWTVISSTAAAAAQEVSPSSIAQKKKSPLTNITQTNDPHQTVTPINKFPSTRLLPRWLTASNPSNPPPPPPPILESATACVINFSSLR